MSQGSEAKRNNPFALHIFNTSFYRFLLLFVKEESPRPPYAKATGGKATKFKPLNKSGFLFETQYLHEFENSFFENAIFYAISNFQRKKVRKQTFFILTLIIFLGISSSKRLLYIYLQTYNPIYYTSDGQFCKLVHHNLSYQKYY